MEAKSILILLLAIVTIDFIYNKVLDYLNIRSMRPNLPDDVKDIYNEKKYEKSIDYARANNKFGMLTSSLSFIIFFILIASGFFGWFDSWLQVHVSAGMLGSIAFFAILFFASDIFNIPFQLYSTFGIEERFGFNKTTPKTFVLDKLKGYLLTAILGGLILYVLLLLINVFGESFWIYFWIVISAFMLFMNMFYTSLILPLFNKLTPLEDGELRDAIQAYSRKINFPLDNIYVIDGSKRSAKSNAFFSGLGKKKKIVLYDTLIKNHTIHELVAVLAHEVGHYKKKHIIYGYILSVLQTGFTLFIMSLIIFNPAISEALGADRMAIHLNLLAFGVLYTPISHFIGIFMNMLSRKNEFEADAFAKETYHGVHLQEALKKLSVDNLSNLFPHPAYVFVHYSHPPLLQRLKAIGK